MIVLWQFEECDNSEPVRKKLTQLCIDYLVVNAPEGHPEKDDVMRKLFGSNKTPALWDTRTGSLIQGQDACLAYLSSR